MKPNGDATPPPSRRALAHKPDWPNEPRGVPSSSRSTVVPQEATQAVMRRDQAKRG